MFRCLNLLLLYLQGFRWLCFFFVGGVDERFFESDVSCFVDKNSCEVGTERLYKDKRN